MIILAVQTSELLKAVRDAGAKGAPVSGAQVDAALALVELKLARLETLPLRKLFITDAGASHLKSERVN